MAERLQTYETHRANDRGLLYLALVIVLTAGLAVGGVFALDSALAPILLASAAVLYVVTMFWLLHKLRAYVLVQQDRIIRLEMRVRLEKVLPSNLRERAKSLTLQQLIALRFASDGELPELVEKVLRDNIQSPDAIKRLIKNWQADFLRV